VPDRLLLTEGPRIDRYGDSWRVVPPLGPVPRDLSRTYPATAATPDRTDRPAQVAAARGVKRLVDANPGSEFALAHRGWHDDALAVVPDGVESIDLSARS
jgi:7-cyano-7-deazaguanine tRNA-ribosyltransferase